MPFRSGSWRVAALIKQQAVCHQRVGTGLATVRSRGFVVKAGRHGLALFRHGDKTSTEFRPLRVKGLACLLPVLIRCELSKGIEKAPTKMSEVEKRIGGILETDDVAGSASDERVNDKSTPGESIALAIYLKEIRGFRCFRTRRNLNSPGQK